MKVKWTGGHSNGYQFSGSPNLSYKVIFTLDNQYNGFVAIENIEENKTEMKTGYRDFGKLDKPLQFDLVNIAYQFRYYVLQQTYDKVKKFFPNSKRIPREEYHKHAPEMKAIEEIIEILKINADEEVLEKYYEGRKIKNYKNPFR